MWAGILRELRYLSTHKWDLSMVTVVPLAIIVMFAAMFYQGKAEHLPIAIIDQDQSALSQNIERYLSLNQTVKIVLITPNIQAAEKQLNQNKIWGYVHIPNGAEQRLVQAQDAEISIAYNQSYFSVGNSISSAMTVSVVEAMANYIGDDYLKTTLPYIDMPTPNVKVSILYNPDMSYEFYLELFVVPAVLHLLLCCCIAFSIGQEFKFKQIPAWIQPAGIFNALGAKVLVYVMIFCCWTWLWMFWLIEFRGWFVAGHLWFLVLAQFLFYSAYALIAASVVLATQNLTKSFGFIAVYGGSSLSFAGVTLPINNASAFTKTWSALIPYTPYAKLQTAQWVIGSPIWVSLPAFFSIVLFCLVFAGLSLFLLYRIKKAASI